MYLLIIKKAYPKVLKGPVVLGSSLIDKIKRGFLDGRKLLYTITPSKSDMTGG